jgi:hypothetical protein
MREEGRYQDCLQKDKMVADVAIELEASGKGG